MKKTMLTGVRPSGNLTLGNYLGVLKNLKKSFIMKKKVLKLL